MLNIYNAFAVGGCVFLPTNSPAIRQEVKTRFKLQLKQPCGGIFLAEFRHEIVVGNHPITLYLYLFLFHSKLSIYFVCSAHMKLTIRNLQYGDFGNYRCISKNSLGETEGSIRVYGKCICIGSLSAAMQANTHIQHTHI